MALALFGGAPALVALLLPRRVGAASPVVQPASATPAAFMARARVLRDQAAAAGDQSFGAVVVRDGRIVGEGPSRVVTNRDPTAHAEMEAIRDAARRLGQRDLSGCMLYTTFRPCPMCGTAAHWAKIDRVIVGEALADLGAPRYGGC